jgi:hypothetical protein
MFQSQEAHKPPMKSSGEADRKQLQLAREQGDAFERTVKEMTQDESHGAAQPAGDFLIGYAVEHAEGLYVMEGGRLVWHNPTNENAHLEIVVQDASDKRFIPGLTVHATLIDGSGREVGTHRQPFLWHPWLFHYGLNWVVPGDGEYTLRMQVEAPDFMRHDKENGKRYAQPVKVEFRNVKTRTGQKIS